MNDPVIETIDGFRVVRDDLLHGGTKRRAIGPLLTGANEFVYAGPVWGYAQLALAYAAQDLGIRATLFIAGRKQRHPRTIKASALDAAIHEIYPGYLSVVRKRAADYCRTVGAVLLPFGLDCPEFIQQLSKIARKTGEYPREVWCCAGSGTLTRALQRAWPDAKHHAVIVGKDSDTGIAKRWWASEKFEQGARKPPPFPSCSNYDAKVWEIMLQNAQQGALFWNVAR